MVFIGEMSSRNYATNSRRGGFAKIVPGAGANREARAPLALDSFRQSLRFRLEDLNSRVLAAGIRVLAI